MEACNAPDKMNKGNTAVSGKKKVLFGTKPFNLIS